MTLRLHGTPLSHFTRKVRALCAELDITYEQVWTSGVLAPAPPHYGDNPLMRVPTLQHGGQIVVESDHIARYLVGLFDPTDRLAVRSDVPAELNALAVANGIMAHEVTLILAQRAGLADVSEVAYFRKLTDAIGRGLAWLDTSLAAAPAARFTYADLTLVCMWQHLAHYALVPLDDYPRLAAHVERLAPRPSLASTAPAASLELARAAGWQPG